ncbi:MAG: hypothetical protein M9890_09435 [Thermomicrobiales bacterium]|nr:hypothetical protein [Thermomicrobiales bacterium]
MDNDGILGMFDLDQEIERFAPGDNQSGRRAEILIKVDRMRVVLVTMNVGAELQEHKAPGPITIHTLRGRMTVGSPQGDVDLPAGHVISFAENVLHSVRAVEAGAFLLTIGYPAARAAAAESRLPIDE